jgi:hypothetical protein
MWIFLSVGAVALFVVFIPTVSWIDGRRKEREAFYKAETIRRITEASPDGSKAAIDLMREQDRIARRNVREGLKIGGLICVGVGVGLLVALPGLAGSHVAMVGAIPALLGAGMLAYAYFFADLTA